MLLPSRTEVRLPGVYLEDVRKPGPPVFATGIPVFLGETGGLGGLDGGRPARLDRAALAAASRHVLGVPAAAPLRLALQVFFDNGGRHCWVAPIAPRAGEDRGAALRRGLAAAAGVDADLVVAPDLAAPGADAEEAVWLQRELLDHCARLGNRFALLDALPGASAAQAARQGRALGSPPPGRNLAEAPAFGSLYHPWPRLRGGLAAGPAAFVAGLLAREGREAGHHPGAANRELETAIDLAAELDRDDLTLLAAAGVNPLLAPPGRGVRVWGERTLAGGETGGRVAAQRTKIALVRWLERNAVAFVFEPDDVFLEARVRRQVGRFLEQLRRGGALAAYEIRSQPDRAAGQLITEIFLQPAGQLERLELRLVLDDAGYHLGKPGQNL